MCTHTSPVPSVAPSGYLKGRQLQDKSENKVSSIRQKSLTSIVDKRKGVSEHFSFGEEAPSPLDMFIMMRSGTLSPEIAKSFEASSKDGGIELTLCIRNISVNVWLNSVAETEDGQREMEGSPGDKLWVKSPTVQDIYLDSNTLLHM